MHSLFTGAEEYRTYEPSYPPPAPVTGERPQHASAMGTTV